MSPLNSVNEAGGRLRTVPGRADIFRSGIADLPGSGLTWQVPFHDGATYTIEVAEPFCDPGNLALLRSGVSSDRRLIVWDSNVPPAWHDAVRAYFTHHGVTADFIAIEGGESCKTLETSTRLVSAFHQRGLDPGRESIVAIGGGALLDVVGFAGSIFRGGIPVVRVPTTLLGYVDASVGIKTGVNFTGGKNLLGTFTPPHSVLLDRGFFSSLTGYSWTGGFGEILKLGLGCDKTIFEMLERGAPSFVRTRMSDDEGQALLYRSIDVMLRELSGNIYEGDLTRTVDLGHTFSQAFEMGDSAIGHGHAVVVDLLISSAISVGRSMMPVGEFDRLVALTADLGLPLAPPIIDLEAMWASLLERMQHRSERQRTPIPTEIGYCEFVDDLSSAEIEAALNRVLAARPRK